MFLTSSLFNLQKILLVLFSVVFIFGAAQSRAAEHLFQAGDHVFVAFPAGNVKDDAFIVGQVKRVQPNGDYLVEVESYVEGHDYGSSCIPMIKKEDPEATALGYDVGWTVWKDTTKLDTQRLDYVVPKRLTMRIDEGKHYFVERNNLYIVFGRWKSDAPVMTLDRIERAQREAKAIRLDGFIPVFELVKYHRKTFYHESNRPLYASERIEPAIAMLEYLQTILQQDATLHALWAAKQRDWPKIGQSSYHYFMIEALDKALADAKDQLYEEGIEMAGVERVQRLRDLTETIKRNS
ncbi:hypothetical protein THMIRHAS_12860 [Thiosulfatimonas sediminis]|uniref:Uncharacterized protein n=1 Tax=Thiosulfatimonas sediminis TaxID=2675054 RepID=A0A6F8PUV2_9GAMM|nr:hypothetical protein [Thiosulfatimonas sediminis]BBP45913.1 hypothetical protein THMIRHAS_12860 [Thiosulfatimonas sediminis]